MQVVAAEDDNDKDRFLRLSLPAVLTSWTFPFFEDVLGVVLQPTLLVPVDFNSNASSFNIWW